MRTDWEGKSVGPPWQPQVWSVGPEALIATATQQLWQDQQDVNASLDTFDRAIAGPQTSNRNETEQVVDSAEAGSETRSSVQPNTGRLGQWNTSVQEMRRTEPLAAWADGTHDGPANPNV